MLNNANIESDLGVILNESENRTDRSELAQNHMLSPELSKKMTLPSAQYHQMLKVYFSSAHTMLDYSNAVFNFIDNIKYYKTDVEAIQELVDDKYLDQALIIMKDLAEFSNSVMEKSTSETQLTDKIDICKLITDTLALLKLVMKSSGIKVKALLPGTSDIFVKGDTFLMSCILENMLSNARDAVVIRQNEWSKQYPAVDDGICMPTIDEPDIIISVQKANNIVLICISSVGVRIPDANKQKLLKQEGTFKPDGTGIGLYESKKVIEDMGGTIQVEDYCDKGTTFCISLPAMVG